MIRVSKLADYGTVIMAYMARMPSSSFTATEIASGTHVSLPTVSKLLKLLTRARLLTSQRGAHGGYILAKSIEQISLADIINALDGEVALTECSHKKGECIVEKNCAIRHQWRNISSVIYDVLQKINLGSMLK